MKLFTVAAAALSLSALAGCGPSMQALNGFASSGLIDKKAPVIAHVHADIAAPPARVWDLLVNAPAWPRWESDIANVSTRDPLTLGQRFTWSEGGNTVHSQVQLFEPERRLGWTGTSYTAKAIHLWRLTPKPNGHTLVTIDESMDGPLMATILSSQELAESGNAWLNNLKRAAERTP